MRRLARATPYVNTGNWKLPTDCVLNAQRNYCPLMWMLHSRCNIKMKYLHERCLELIYNDKSSSFKELLQKDRFIPTHHKNIKEIAIEMFKVEEPLFLEILKDIFVEANEDHFKI